MAAPQSVAGTDKKPPWFVQPLQSVVSVEGGSAYFEAVVAGRWILKIDLRPILRPFLLIGFDCCITTVIFLYYIEPNSFQHFYLFTFFHFYLFFSFEKNWYVANSSIEIILLVYFINL